MMNSVVYQQCNKDPMPELVFQNNEIRFSLCRERVVGSRLSQANTRMDRENNTTLELSLAVPGLTRLFRERRIVIADCTKQLSLQI